MVFLPRALRLAALAVSFRARRAASGTALRRRRSGGGRRASDRGAAAPRRTGGARLLFVPRKDERRIGRESIARGRRLRPGLRVSASGNSHPVRPEERSVTVSSARAAWNFAAQQMRALETVPQRQWSPAPARAKRSPTPSPRGAQIPAGKCPSAISRWPQRLPAESRATRRTHHPKRWNRQ